HADKDPSSWVFIAFLIFFSMIVADAGYGLLLLACTLWIKYKFKPKKGLAKRILSLATYLSIGCIVWGVLTTSFFGIEISQDNPWKKISITDWAITQKANYFIKQKPPAYEQLIKEYPEAAKATTGKELLFSVNRMNEQGEETPVIYNTF